MAYRKKAARSSYRKSGYKKSYTPKKRAGRAREQVVKIVLQHHMMQPTPTPTLAAASIPPSKAKQPKL